MEVEVGDADLFLIEAGTNANLTLQVEILWELSSMCLPMQGLGMINSWLEPNNWIYKKTKIIVCSFYFYSYRVMNSCRHHECCSESWSFLALR